MANSRRIKSEAGHEKKDRRVLDTVRRGVHEEKYPPVGYKSWVIVTSTGLRLARVEVKDVDANERFINTMWDLLDRVDPLTTRLTMLR